jgi:hypothetical protein
MRTLACRQTRMTALVLSNAEDTPIPLSQHFLHHLMEVTSNRYLNKWRKLAKTFSNMHLILEVSHQLHVTVMSQDFDMTIYQVYKKDAPDPFWSYMCMNPDTFDALVAALEPDAVFSGSKSNNTQMPLEQQLAIALYHFRHFGNAASVKKVAYLMGVSYGTVENATTCVLTAVCHAEFCLSIMQWPDDTAREMAKQEVEWFSCPGWRDGWLMVNGSLVPLYGRPGYYGNTWFDHKHNYSMNVQVTPFPYSQSSFL